MDYICCQNLFMVTCKLIGRTGNQMFIIAATISYALEHGLEFHIPMTGTFKHLTNARYNPYLPVIKVNEETFHYKPLPFQKLDNVNYELNGYFQSYKYFPQDVYKYFNIPYTAKPGWTAIHYRSGDYKNLPLCHPIVTQAYLKQAINVMMERGVNQFVVFSDEMKKAIEIMPRPYNTLFIFSEGNELEDLALGSGCENIIGSNSSFSLWMYYLNRNIEKISIFPKKWFGPQLPHNTKDLYPPNCVIL